MKHADFSQASLVAQTVKNLPAVQETRLQTLGWENLVKGMATHFSLLAWRIPWTEEPGGLQSVGLQRVGHKLVTEQQKNSSDCWLLSMPAPLPPSPENTHTRIPVVEQGGFIALCRTTGRSP